MQIDQVIQEKIYLVEHANEMYSFVPIEDADCFIKAKFRGIDPWILQNGKIISLTQLRPQIREKFHSTKNRQNRGWPIKFFSPEMKNLYLNYNLTK